MGKLAIALTVTFLTWAPGPAALARPVTPVRPVMPVRPVTPVRPAVPAGAGTGAAAMPPHVPASAIPDNYRTWYLAAAQTCPGLSWTVLAAIGTIESGNGQDPGPGIQDGSNWAGAEGPMQFEASTFARYAVNADPRSRPSPYDPADAIFTAARLLCARGAGTATPAGLRKALLAYNDAHWYVRLVLAQAATFQRPLGAGPVARRAVTFAETQLGKPYLAGGTGPGGYDSAGLAYAGYASAGITIGRSASGWRHDGTIIPVSQVEPGDLLLTRRPGGTTRPEGTRRPKGAGKPRDRLAMYAGGDQVIKAAPGHPVQLDPADLTGVIAVIRPAG